MSLNRAIIVGRLTRDPELRYTPSGHAVANFNIAVNRPFKNEQGEQEADFINCVTWRKQAENLANHMKKGSLIGVDGRIQTRTYDHEGRTVYVTEVLAESIQFLESRNSNQQNGGPSHGPRTGQPQANTAQPNPFQGEGQQIDIQDDLPF